MSELTGDSGIVDGHSQLADGDFHTEGTWATGRNSRRGVGQYGRSRPNASIQQMFLLASARTIATWRAVRCCGSPDS